MTDFDNKLVSVVIPSFNRARVLEQAIDSALKQTYPHIEIVVVDDGSTDDTLERLERLQEPRLKVLSTPRNLGPARARNLGIEHCAGAYIAFLDSDDTWTPWKIETQIACFKRGEPELGAVYCGRRVRLTDGSTLDVRPGCRGDIFATLRRRNTIPLPTLMVRREVLEKVGTFDPELPACEDWDLVLRIAQRYTFDFIEGLAVAYDGAGSDRMSARARSVFIANHVIFRRFNGRGPRPDILAAYLALQSRELLHLRRPRRAARYALRSLLLEFDDEERLALRTLRQLLARWSLGRFLVQAFGWRGALTWR
ncbi:glycosyltransferase [Thalassobaculum sp.]|uniref:glycosyltransferase family 2 protein n=1 Tax=Thalassobaculum sp. TaxID=2022740 RepID=UPI0032ED327D